MKFIQYSTLNRNPLAHSYKDYYVKQSLKEHLKDALGILIIVMVPVLLISL